MSVKIRMTKIGKSANKNYHFRVVAIDSHKARDGRFLEELGFYDPSKKPAQIKLNLERIAYWIKCGAKQSDTVASLVKRAKKSQTKT